MCRCGDINVRIAQPLHIIGCTQQSSSKLDYAFSCTIISVHLCVLVVKQSVKQLSRQPNLRQSGPLAVLKSVAIGPTKERERPIHRASPICVHLCKSVVKIVVSDQRLVISEASTPVCCHTQPPILWAIALDHRKALSSGSRWSPEVNIQLPRSAGHGT